MACNLYLDKHRYSNTDTTDLWDALEVASGQPVRATMGTWVDQAGHPLVSAELATDGTELSSLSGVSCWTGASDNDQRWVVPVSLRYATTDGSTEHEQLLLEDASTTVDAEGQAGVGVGKRGGVGCLPRPLQRRPAQEAVRIAGSAGRQGTPEPGV